jgi:hypothetical protein
MTYPCPTWEFAADIHLLKLQRLQNKVLNFVQPRHTLVRQFHTDFPVPYIYNYVTKLCRQQAEVTQNHENVNVHDIGNGEARHRKYKRHKTGSGQAYDRSSD